MKWTREYRQDPDYAVGPLPQRHLHGKVGTVCSRIAAMCRSILEHVTPILAWRQIWYSAFPMTFWKLPAGS